MCVLFMSSALAHLNSGALLIVLISSLFSHRHRHGLRKVLHNPFGAPGWSSWETRSQRAFRLVESVFGSNCLNRKNVKRWISGKCFQPTRLPSAPSRRIVHSQKSKRGGAPSSSPLLRTPHPSHLASTEISRYRTCNNYICQLDFPEKESKHELFCSVPRRDALNFQNISLVVKGYNARLPLRNLWDGIQTSIFLQR